MTLAVYLVVASAIFLFVSIFALAFEGPRAPECNIKLLEGICKGHKIEITNDVPVLRRASPVKQDKLLDALTDFPLLMQIPCRRLEAKKRICSRQCFQRKGNFYRFFE